MCVCWEVNDGIFFLFSLPSPSLSPLGKGRGGGRKGVEVGDRWGRDMECSR